MNFSQKGCFFVVYKSCYKIQVVYSVDTRVASMQLLKSMQAGIEIHDKIVTILTEAEPIHTTKCKKILFSKVVYIVCDFFSS